MKARAKVARKRMPRFSNEDEERQFWTGHDTVDFFDWGKAVRATFPELRPSTANISLRLPTSMLDELKALANERDVPYQSLLKVFLAERIANERGMRRKVPA